MMLRIFSLIVCAALLSGCQTIPQTPIVKEKIVLSEVPSELFKPCIPPPPPQYYPPDFSDSVDWTIVNATKFNHEYTLELISFISQCNANIEAIRQNQDLRRKALEEKQK